MKQIEKYQLLTAEVDATLLFKGLHLKEKV
jgi:hypothetical protein